MAMVSAQQAADNWASGMSNSTQKIKAGIQAVTESPTAKAARAVDRQVAGVQRAASEGKTARALNAVSLEDWKAAALNKGVNRIASGAAASKPKMANFLSQFLPYVQSGKDRLDSTMPRGDRAANIARMVEMVNYLGNFKKSG